MAPSTFRAKLEEPLKEISALLADREDRINVLEQQNDLLRQQNDSLRQQNDSLRQHPFTLGQEHDAANESPVQSTQMEPNIQIPNLPMPTASQSGPLAAAPAAPVAIDNTDFTVWVNAAGKLECNGSPIRGSAWRELEDKFTVDISFFRGLTWEGRTWSQTTDPMFCVRELLLPGKTAAGRPKDPKVRWTIEQPGKYACKSCLNKCKLCLKYNVEKKRLELLAFPGSVRRSQLDKSWFVAPTFTQSNKPPYKGLWQAE